MRGLQFTSAVLLILIYLLPANSQVLVRTIPSGSTTANALAWDGEAFWVGNNSANILRVSYTDGAILDTIVSPVNGSDGLAWDGIFLWTISAVLARPWIYQMDVVTGNVVDSIPDLTTGRSGGMAWNNSNFWLSRNQPGDSLLRVNDIDGTVLQRFPVDGDMPRGVAFDGGNLWYGSTDTAGTDEDRVYRVNPTTGLTTWSFILPQHVSQPDRRLRGATWVDGHLWLVAYEQNTTQIKLHEYDVSNAEDPDIEIEQTSHDFGETVFGNLVQWSFDIANIGNISLILDSAVFAVGTAYTIDEPDFPASVGAGSAIEMEIHFDPLNPGVYSDTLFIYSNDPDEPVVQVTMTGICLSNEGIIEVFPTELDFGTVWTALPGWSTSRIVEIHNTGFGELTINNAQILIGDAYFLEQQPFPIVMASQSMTTVRVWFDPDVPTFYDGILTISSDDSDDPVVDIPMTGQAHNTPFELGGTIWNFFANGDDFDNSINAVAGIEDVNGDGAPDAIACSGNGLTYCLNGTSSEVADTFWTFNTRAETNHSGYVYYDRALAIIGDLTGDDVDDVIIGTAGGSRSVYAISGATGEELWMFDTRELDGAGAWVHAVRVIEDINGDLVNDVVAAIGSNIQAVIAVSGVDGELIWEGGDEYDTYYAVAVINDVTGDGIQDVVGGSVGDVVGLNGANGDVIWDASVSNGSPVFDLENMGSANPEVNQSEDIAVASAYYGIFAIDGADGDHIWIREIDGTFLYQITVGSDINDDDIREVYVGTTGGHLLCINSEDGLNIWDEIVDDQSENVLSLAAIEDMSGDGIMDIACGTLGDYIVVMEGWDGHDLISTQGTAQGGAVDAVGVLQDVDGTNRIEVLAGNREGVVMALAGGGTSINSDIAGTVTEFSTNTPIASARIWVTGHPDTLFTNEIGVYTFPIIPGTYTVNVRKQGYCSDEEANVVVSEFSTTTQDFSLRQPNIQFSATSLNLVTPQEQNTSTTFEISNPATPTICPVEYSITDNVDWLTVNPISGTIPIGDVEQITVNANVAGLPVGEYDAVISVIHNDTGNPRNIPVTLAISLDADNGVPLPTEFAFYQNYPNPFNAATTFKFDVPSESRVVISLVNVMGQIAATVVDEVYPAGRHSYSFNANDLPSGMYFVRMNSKDFASVKKLVLMK